MVKIYLVFINMHIQIIIIKPQELYRRLVNLHPNPEIIQTYLTVTKLKTCWENRGLNRHQYDMIISNKIEPIKTNSSENNVKIKSVCFSDK